MMVPELTCEGTLCALFTENIELVRTKHLSPLFFRIACCIWIAGGGIRLAGVLHVFTLAMRILLPIVLTRGSAGNQQKQHQTR